MSFTFNHSYILKHDQKRVFIVADNNNFDGPCMQGWMSRIHPIYAMIFSFLSQPISLEIAADKIANFLDIKNKESSLLLKMFIDSKEPFVTEYNGIKSYFPPNIIIPSNQLTSEPHFQYEPQQFIYSEVNVEQERCISSPIGIVYMVNNQCSTNCLYCYADKDTRSSMMTLDDVEKLCKDARETGITSITLSGGEVFLYPKWNDLIDLLTNYGYKPNLISTKVPLSENDIRIIKRMGLKIQISLDAFDSNTLISLLNVNNNYLEKLKCTIANLEKYEIDYQIATIITSLNDSIANLNILHEFISTLIHLSRWEIRIAFRSLYSRSDFDLFKVRTSSIEKIEKWVNDIKNKTNVNILWSPNNGRTYFAGNEGSRSFSGSRCSANYSHMVVLPDGNVTICEQLYWNPRFIIGNVKQNTIEEIWHSPNALYLSNIANSDIRNTSICSTCSLYEKCIKFPNKCYADVLKAYGDDNWDYPDPRCSKAPKFINSMD